MVGNSAEEGLMQQIGNPSHVDIGRIAVPAGGVAGLIMFLTIDRIFPILGLGGRWVFAALVAVTVAGVVWQRLFTAQRAREVAEMEKTRATQEAETERRIAAMKGGQK